MGRERSIAAWSRPRDAAPPDELKNAQRLDDARLAEILNERGMADLDGLREMLQTSNDGGMTFCESVVSAGLVSDWDLSRVVSELFQLPFLPVDLCKPDPELWEELESPLMHQNALVPLRRFGQLLTVAMPGLVAADVLGMLAAETDLLLLPVVGTVETNRRWLETNATRPEGGGGDWGSLFDEGDAAVRASLDDEDEPAAPVPSEDLDLGALEFTDEGLDLDEGGLEELDELTPPSLVDTTDALELEDEAPDSSPSIELPPQPEF